MLVLPLLLYRHDGTDYLDSQACNGLRQWLLNFDHITVCLLDGGSLPAPATAIALESSRFGDRCTLVRLPNERQPLGFFRAYRRTHNLLGQIIDNSAYLHFMIGGLWGDWAAVAALIAAARGRKAAVWTDRVESRVTFHHAVAGKGLRKYYRHATAFAMQVLEREVVRRSALGLFHGADCYEAYARYSPNPHIVHDIHLSAETRIGPDALATKAARRAPLRIVYAGRIHPDKGVLDWIETLNVLRASGTPFTADWYGEGPQREEALEMTARLRLDGIVRFPGPINDHAALIARMKEADIFLFCHLTPESPRCLIEALISGTPIIGYESAYPADLIGSNKGGILTPRSPQKLAATIKAIDADRDHLATLFYAAARDGEAFTDTEVFRHRSDLMKTYC